MRLVLPVFEGTALFLSSYLFVECVFKYTGIDYDWDFANNASLLIYSGVFVILVVVWWL